MHRCTGPSTLALWYSASVWQVEQRSVLVQVFSLLEATT